MEEVQALAQAAGISIPPERLPLLSATAPIVRQGLEAMLVLPLTDVPPASTFFPRGAEG